jgi:hypothetical protein
VVKTTIDDKLVVRDPQTIRYVEKKYVYIRDSFTCAERVREK